MKVYLEPPHGLSRAMGRVAGALTYYAPSNVEIVKEHQLADHVILHVIGYDDTVEAIERLQKQRKTFSMIQYCLRTTQRPSTREWITLWEDAKLVWSYYDLPTLAREDYVDFKNINFYYAGLGVNADVFRPRDTKKVYTVFTSGYVAATECVQEVAAAVRRLNGRQFHLGPDMKLGEFGVSLLDIDDVDLSHQYSSSHFVVGLRRIEGFELPAAEGLLCGARPIMFDQPHYRRWFEDFADFIPEGSVKAVTDSLTELFSRGPRPVSPAERTLAIDNFNWETISRGFWKSF